MLASPPKKLQSLRILNIPKNNLTLGGFECNFMRRYVASGLLPFLFTHFKKQKLVRKINLCVTTTSRFQEFNAFPCQIKTGKCFIGIKNSSWSRIQKRSKKRPKWGYKGPTTWGPRGSRDGVTRVLGVAQTPSAPK